MELDGRRHLDLVSFETSHAPDGAHNPATAPSRRRDDENFPRVVTAGRPARAQMRRAADKAASRQQQGGDPALVPTRASAPAVKEALVVDSDIRGAGAVAAALRRIANVDVCTDFRNARARLLQEPPDVMITNLRLGPYNGLHLVHLAAPRTRCIVFSTPDDVGFAHEVQAAGAFFELSVRLPHVLESYVRATLPPNDRRDITGLGQLPLQGGRRCTDR